MSSQRRDHLVDTAVRLFQQQGYHATGIEQILSESGVAKKTLYNHFKSKDELILAALRRWDQESRNRLMRSVEARTSDPRERILVFFDVLEEWFESSSFSGCMFIAATAEYPKLDDPIHVAAAEHLRLLERYVREQAEAARAPDAAKLASQVMLLIEGAIVITQVTGRTGVGAEGRAAATLLVANAMETLVDAIG